jgi:hypothetical protein
MVIVFENMLGRILIKAEPGCPITRTATAGQSPASHQAAKPRWGVEIWRDGRLKSYSDDSNRVFCRGSAA